jgi:glycosyltransferase involved in cell wall biosynthesis
MSTDQADRIPCSVGILTFNSGKTLTRALESVKACDDVFINDGGSTDDTLAIARVYGCRVIEQDQRYKDTIGKLTNFGGARNQCLEAAKHEWFLYIDADEAASPELIEELREITAQGSECVAYRIPERFVIGGTHIRYSSNYPGYQYRVLRTDKGTRFVKPVHEQPPRFVSAPDTRFCTLKGEWYVFWEEEDVREYEKRNFKYLDLEVKRHAGMSWGTFLFRFLPRMTKSIVSITLKSLFIRLLHPRASVMPWAVEWGRIRYHASLIARITQAMLHPAAV